MLEVVSAGRGGDGAIAWSVVCLRAGWGQTVPARAGTERRFTGTNREKSMSKLFGVGVAIAAATMALSVGAQQPPAQSQPTEQSVMKNRVIVTVNGDPVYASDVSLMMRDIQARQRGQKIPEQQLVEMGTGRVIERKLLAQEATKRGIKPNDQRIEANLAQIVKQAGGREALDGFLATGGTDYAALKQIVTESDLAQSLIETQIQPTINVTEDDITKFYNDNPDMFKTDEQVRARHILFKVPQDADEATAKAARDKAVEARKRALAGEDFAKLAQELSEGPSASKGGDLGFFTHDQMVPAFADAAFALQPGQISDVVRTRFGFHVIKVEDRKPAGTRTLDEVHDRLKAVIAQGKVGDAVEKLLDELRKSASIKAMGKPDDAEPAAGTGASAPAGQD